MTEETQLLEVACGLDPASAGAERDRILACLDAHTDGAIVVSLASGAATQPSLQLYFATLKEARLRGIAISPAIEATADGAAGPGEEGAR